MIAAGAPYSLLKRLALAFSILAILVLSLAGGLLYHTLSLELRRRDDREIAGKLQEFMEQARTFGSAVSVAQNGAVFQEALLSHPAVSFAISGGRGELLVYTGGRGERLASGLGKDAESGPFTCNPPVVGPARCVVGREKLLSGETIQVVLAHAAHERHAVLRAFQEDVLLVLVGGSLLMGSLGYAIAKRGLAPVKTIGARISSIEAHNLDNRLQMGGGAVELRDIAVPVNRMLDRLERAFTRLSQFSSDLAHDMRTPLANIISSSQITLSRPRTIDEYETLIDSNIEECERLQRMIETMLFLARADHARQQLKLGSLDCQSEFAKLTAFFDAVAENKSVQFLVDGHVQVRADPTLFRRAVSNLLSNALEHAGTASEVALRAFRSGEYVAVQVINNGESIPPEHIDKIFDRFYRVNAAREGSAKNTGLGLAIVKAIMESHRGKVEVVSRAGSTAFTLYFPTLV
ncbi:Sensor protein CzcS [Paraburkholderia kirstenboschensis]|uniref:heavy metal sensor histidine kinase n=1 Tax=Paraburkholderia kirstenboschensis TaxID=1245436 RepID=UPI001918CDE1|nr:heavy metal sensor histidine kinase [Paraburkholderia kirstenboschensis]CAD6557373.1 Sensor protein CzcS [Paraburkholderia kirstenboschensis]